MWCPSCVLCFMTTATLQKKSEATPLSFFRRHPTLALWSLEDVLVEEQVLWELSCCRQCGGSSLFPGNDHSVSEKIKCELQLGKTLGCALILHQAAQRNASSPSGWRAAPAQVPLPWEHRHPRVLPQLLRRCLPATWQGPSSETAPRCQSLLEVQLQGGGSTVLLFLRNKEAGDSVSLGISLLCYLFFSLPYWPTSSIAICIIFIFSQTVSFWRTWENLYKWAMS